MLARPNVPLGATSVAPPIDSAPATKLMPLPGAPLSVLRSTTIPAGGPRKPKARGGAALLAVARVDAELAREPGIGDRGRGDRPGRPHRAVAHHLPVGVRHAQPEHRRQRLRDTGAPYLHSALSGESGKPDLREQGVEL